ncbi:hypothetical protein EDC30_106104 [Paucimonas lemoignei]|uniref:Uncharacterized protein n=1 Tax=Paucimonas lemoignei TaxID=29443 RepID=A0A4R3HUZ7_PAULE|nr:hypothetical protein EDC30_106104 [Paucimonas lemoignei]
MNQESRTDFLTIHYMLSEIIRSRLDRHMIVCSYGKRDMEDMVEVLECC